LISRLAVEKLLRPATTGREKNSKGGSVRLPPSVFQVNPKLKAPNLKTQMTVESPTLECQNYPLSVCILALILFGIWEFSILT
jgi:hypothetical protein